MTDFDRFPSHDDAGKTGKLAMGFAAGALSAAVLYRRWRQEDSHPDEERQPALADDGGDDLAAVYLHDHLAGARAALKILEDLQSDHAGEPLGRFAQEMLLKIREDREALEEIAEKISGRTYSRGKDVTAWIGSKLTRAKLGRNLVGEFGTLQALETVALGILGKLAMWRALAVAAVRDPRLEEFDLEYLAGRAEEQHEEVEAWRLKLAGSVLPPTNS